jgi:flavin reductase (DIM6/NTAB) family NADH-FMN oxidoreductase RutF
MKDFTQIVPGDITRNPFQLIGGDWMLITAGTIGSFNTMTASWGTIGHLWERDVAICYVRPQRYTYGFMERSGVYTLSFFDPNWRRALEYCGNHSGRDVDKMAETGLAPVETPGGAVAFEQARLVLECRKLYAGDITEPGFVDATLVDEVYAKRDFHRFYVGQIVRALARP